MSNWQDVELDVIPLEDFTNLKISSSKSEITLDVVTLEDVDNVDAVLSTERYTLEINQPLKGTTTNLARKLSYLVIVFAMISIASGGVAFKMFPDEVSAVYPLLFFKHLIRSRQFWLVFGAHKLWSFA